MNLREARRRLVPSHVNDRDYFAFQGGLNLVDTPLKMMPGQLLACQNYEPGIKGGYSSLEGYERLDGRTAPSAASYWILKYTDRQLSPDPGSTITGVTSGATGVLLTEVAEDDGLGSYVLTQVSGTFQDGEVLEFTGVPLATANGLAIANDAPTDEQDAAYALLATNAARSLIEAVPGSGRVLGVVVYNGVVYAFRNNADGTAAVMHQATPTGWQAVELGAVLRFDAGQAAALVEGDTVTGATSGASASVRRLVVQSGTFASNDAAGYLVLGPITDGPFEDDEALQVGGTTRATADGAEAAQTLLPDGNYEFRVHNFYGHTNRRRVYGVDGVNHAFEYQDGATPFFAPILTGMPIDTPTHLGVHRSQLWLSFAGGSIQKSGVGDPLVWQVSLGAAEMGIGDECTGFLEEIGNTLFVFARNSSHYVAGTEESYSLEAYNREVGAAAGTIQRIGRGIYLDDRGFSTLAASQNYGNYSYNSFSTNIQPLIRQIKLNSTTSCISASKSLYRCFFKNGQFVTVAINGSKIVGITTSDYGVVVRCAYAGEEEDGTELLVFGSDNGFVYRADSGTSFDGAPIQTFMRPVFHFSRTPSRRKRYRRAQFDVSVAGPCVLQIGVDYSFSDPDEPSEPIGEVPMEGGGGFWNVDNWNEFRWNAGSGASAIIKLEGAGINIGFLIASSSATQRPHSVDGVSLHNSQRRLNRGTSNA